MNYRIAVAAIAFIWPGFIWAESSLLKPEDRILFIGDSITGQGGNDADGWARLIQEALVAAGGNQKVISLGASGITVAGWWGILERSEKGPVFTDVKEFEVGASLKAGADVVVFMLGMNEVAAPTLPVDESEYKYWTLNNYADLINRVKALTHPRVIAIATPTMCTEDPNSPKNETMRKLAALIEDFAKENGYVVLPTYASMLSLLKEGRAYSPDFHVTRDFIHPNHAGHVAIAMGMLEGLGESKAAKGILEKNRAELFPSTGKSLSYWVHPHLEVMGDDKMSFDIEYFYHPAPGASAATPITLEVPAGWVSRSLDSPPNQGRFQVEGVPDQLINTLTLKAGDQSIAIPIQAPWLIGMGNGKAAWLNNVIDPPRSVFPADAELSRGIGFGGTVQLDKDNAITGWKRFVATADYDGTNAPGSVDLAQTFFYPQFSVAYGARWIYSETAQSVQISVSPLSVYQVGSFDLWLNGTNLLNTPLLTNDQPTLSTALVKGWNALIFKTNHSANPWTFKIDLKDPSGRSLSGIRISTTPQKVAVSSSNFND